MTLAHRILVFGFLLLAGTTLLGCRPAASVRTGGQAMAAPAPEPPSPAYPSTQEVIARLDVPRMQAHVQRLAGDIGVRKSGTAREQAAADYVAEQLTDFGYTVTRRVVPLPGEKQSVNIFAALPGASEKVLLIGAHFDSKAPAPGANDNASGVAVVLELARVLQDARPACTLLFAGFGAEERIGRRRDAHHFGSRALAADAALRGRLAGMVSLDMVGYGTVLRVDNQGQAAATWRDRIGRVAADMKLPVTTGRSRPNSDHEAFERRGIPAAYVHWERDPAYHRRGDVPAHLQPTRLRQTAELMVRVALNGGQ